jgi:hypothetical protein
VDASTLRGESASKTASAVRLRIASWTEALCSGAGDSGMVPTANVDKPGGVLYGGGSCLAEIGTVIGDER